MTFPYRFAAAAMLALAPVAAPAVPPKLTLVISVDQLSGDLFDAYRPAWRHGMARLSRGTVFRGGYQAQSATETCPGHSTITTGSYPSRSGIIANNWVDLSAAREDKVMYCAEDERVAGSSSTRYTVSPVHLLVPTFGERLKAAHAGSRSVAVAGKDRAAVMMSGKNVDQRWYWSKGAFVTDRGGAAPATVARVKAAAKAALALPTAPMAMPRLCQGKARPIALADSERSVGDGRFARNEDDEGAFRASPELDAQTIALAEGLIDELQLGKSGAPDTLSLSLSATDYVGHKYGTGGSEMCLQMLALDRAVGGLLDFLDNRGLDYSVVLTADHGGLDIPERARLKGDRHAVRADPALAPGRMGLELASSLGLESFGLSGEGAFGDTYVDRSLSPRDRQRMLDAAVAAYRAHPQVAAVFTASELARAAMPRSAPDRWSLADKVRANFFPGRSGDFIVLLKKDVTPIWETSGTIATHGSPWEYDRRVPILFYRPGQKARGVARAVATVDILPTLAALQGIAVDPRTIDGRCLPEVAAERCGR